MIWIFLNLLCCGLIVLLFIYARIHKPVKVKIDSVVRKRLKRISIGAFVLYLLTLSSPFYYQQVYYHRLASGMTLNPAEEFVYSNGEYVLLMLIPIVCLGLSNIVVYEAKSRTGTPKW